MLKYKNKKSPMRCDAVCSAWIFLVDIQLQQTEANKIGGEKV